MTLEERVKRLEKFHVLGHDIEEIDREIITLHNNSINSLGEDIIKIVDLEEERRALVLEKKEILCVMKNAM